MDGFLIMCGLIGAGMAIDNGLCRIANALRNRQIDVNLKMPPIVIKGDGGDSQP